jgi:TfoX/Sxy family transcriptional regulator of competence genes
MKMPKPTEADRARFQSLVPDDPGVVVKPMFGNLGAFVNGNMFMGLFGADIGVKLPTAQLADLMAAGGGPFGPAERPMGGYATVPATLSLRAARSWTARALAHVAELPPKAAKPK